MKNSKNGITLIALVITIIVLLILAGISISLVTGQNGVLTKAQDANSTYSVASAKEQASMKAAGYVSEYMQKVYVDNDSTVGAMTTGEYVLSQINGEEDGNYRYSISGNTISVVNKTTGETLAEGTIDDNGGISWSDSVASGGNNSIGVTISDELKTAAQNGTATGTIELSLNRTFDWPAELSSDANVYDDVFDTLYGDIEKHLINGNWSSVSNGLYNNGESGSYYNSETDPTDEYIDMTITSWKILRVNNNGTVDLVPAELTWNGVFLGGAQGYNNGVKLLNDACSALYGDSSRGITARSINIEDIEGMMNETETGRNLLASAKSREQNGYVYGQTNTYENCYAPAIYSSESTLGLSRQNSYFTSRDSAKTQYTTGANALTITQKFYEMSAQEIGSALGKYASLLFFEGVHGPWCWIASRCVSARNFFLMSIAGDIGFGVDIMYDGRSDGFGLTLFPIVTLTRGTIVDNGNGTYSLEMN